MTDVETIVRKQGERIRSLELEIMKLQAGQTNDIRNHDIHTSTLINPTIVGETTDTSDTTHTGIHDFNEDVEIAADKYLYAANLTVRNVGAGDDVLISSDDAAAVVTIAGSLGVNQNIECIDGIFAAATVKIGDQLLSESDYLVVSDAATPGIYIKDTGDNWAEGATGTIHFTDDENVDGFAINVTEATSVITSTSGLLLRAGATDTIDLNLVGEGMEQVKVTDGTFEPHADNDIDLGTAAKEFKDLWIDGTAYLDTADIGALAGDLDIAGFDIVNPLQIRYSGTSRAYLSLFRSNVSNTNYSPFLEVGKNSTEKLFICPVFNSSNKLTDAWIVTYSTGGVSAAGFGDIVFKPDGVERVRFKASGDVQFGAHDINFANDIIYKVEADGNAVFKDIKGTGNFISSASTLSLKTDNGANIGFLLDDDGSSTYWKTSTRNSVYIEVPSGTVLLQLTSTALNIRSTKDLLMNSTGAVDARLKLPYLTGVPASADNGSIWMEADGLHIYYNGSEKVVAGV